MKTVIVLGAGPAGLAAAVAAREVGARVVLLDSADDMGGQYWRHAPATRSSLGKSPLQHDWSTFEGLRERLVGDSLCEIVTSAHVWAIEGTKIFVMVGEPDGTNRDARVYNAAAVVMATGAYDRTLPVPGWDLPGVFTAGAAQAMAKGDGIAVGRRVAVSGAGPFLLPVAVSLVQVGSTVAGVYEASHITKMLRSWTARPWELVGAIGKVSELVGYASNHVRNRIPYVTGRAVTAIHGVDRVESVTVSAIDRSWAPIVGTEKIVEVDAVCLSHGFTPRLELPIAAGCLLNERRFIEVDENQRTSVAGVFAAGEITGIGGVDLALSEGTIAGHVAAGGKLSDQELRRYRGRRRTFSQFGARIEDAHGIGANWSHWLTDETTICRCERVNFGRLCSVADVSQSSGLRSLKLLTRVGLGLCQGRVCGRTVEELLAKRVPGGQLVDGVISDRRPIAVPIRLGELAGPFTDFTDRDLIKPETKGIQ
jgi:NADPH-dependent 2,4-dienoyl-CoA reductase/sulfur reductase-like enzyme